ncbi:hypothetical protein CNECB9_460023 [Cupriavidus necator]|uniref:Uncharacterized protein n=1 Tax=Cupriavidus necator TaxID=106590 RepID=A0A1K0IMH3_CUPNE|nr:hypothetical protein CNECB9_460023 [Cupriavidus necator]
MLDRKALGHPVRSRLWLLRGGFSVDQAGMCLKSIIIAKMLDFTSIIDSCEPVLYNVREIEQYRFC